MTELEQAIDDEIRAAVDRIFEIHGAGVAAELSEMLLFHGAALLAIAGGIDSDVAFDRLQDMLQDFKRMILERVARRN